MTKGITIIIIALMLAIAVKLEAGPITAISTGLIVVYVGFNERRREITNKTLGLIKEYFQILTKNR